MNSNILALCLFAAPVMAQQSVTSASLSGVVQDASEAPLSGATVTLKHLERDSSQRAVSPADGQFRFVYLPAGNYELTVHDPRFPVFVRRFPLAPSQSAVLPVRLSLAAVTETLTVFSASDLLDSHKAQVSDSVRPAEIDSLPLNGRNYLDLALLVPGVSRTNVGSSQRFAETSAVPGTGISVAGQRNLNNSFVLDGLSANDDAAALAGVYLSQEVIREFQVITSGASTEFGRSSAGVVSVTTRSGASDWHSRLYGFGRSNRFDARNALASAKDPLTQAQYGASTGGPLFDKKMFLFSNFEQTRRRAAGFITISPANVAAINTAYPAASLITGQFPTGWNTFNYFARVDRQVGRTQMNARYMFYDISSENARTVGALNDASRGTSLKERDHGIAGNATTLLSPNLVNEFRGQVAISRLSAPPNDPGGPAVNISGVASFGQSTSSPIGRDSDSYQLNDTLGWNRGRHFVKAGVDVLLNRVNIDFPGALHAGVYSFASLESFQARRYITYQQAFGLPTQFQSNPNFAAFLQDEWKPLNSLTLQLGVRYDAQMLPSPIGTDTNNVAPRFGIAWAPGKRNTVVRAAYGLYYDRIPLRATSNALQRDGVKYKVALVSFAQTGAPEFPQRMASFPEGQLVNITSIDPAIEPGYAQQASLQVEHRLGDAATFTAGYQWLRGLHLILSRNVNAPTAAGAPNLGRPDSRYANISRFESSGDSYYSGLLVSIKFRAGSNADLRVSYNLSKAIDNTGNFFFSQPQNALDLRDERALSDNDQRHRLTISGFVRSPARHAALRNWTIAPLFSYNSALPFNVLTGNDRNGDTNVNDRPFGVGRNTGRGFDYVSLDVRLSRAFQVSERGRIEILAESFNALNHTNLQFPNNVFGTAASPRPTFGQATAVADPRLMQLGVRLDF